MTFGRFFRDNRRWLGGALLLTFSSSVGQTFFIALFAGDIRGELELSHGQFGGLYMLATLASASTLIFLGRVVDVMPARPIAAMVLLMLAACCVLMSIAQHVLLLLVALYGLRLFGQGMLSHVAMTAMARWYVAQRGRAVSISSVGHQLGEGVLPIVVVLLIARYDWRTGWLIAAGLLILAIPCVYHAFAVDRVPNAADRALESERQRQWTRAEALRDGAFWRVCSGVLAPAFIGTSVFFHQVHLGQIKGWPAGVIASSFALLSITTVSTALLAGSWIDRASAQRLLPLFLLPLALACVVLGIAESALLMYVFMFLLGLSYGVSTAVFGAIWPEIYGTRHLGSIRAVVFAAMVFASAVGPGLTGWLIDVGIGFEEQLFAMALYCLLAFAVLLPVARRAILPVNH